MRLLCDRKTCFMYDLGFRLEISPGKPGFGDRKAAEQVEEAAEQGRITERLVRQSMRDRQGSG